MKPAPVVELFETECLQFDMPYEWDEEKRIEALEAREIDFASVDYFDWNGALHRRSDRGGEIRWASIGLIGDRLHHVVWTVRSGNIRIISLRKANACESREYEEET